MGKGRQAHQQKNRRTQDTNQHRVSKKNGVARRQHSQQLGRTPTSALSRVSTRGELNGNRAANAKSNQSQQYHTQVPLASYDDVLLVGEGDFSFTFSLAAHHKVRSITATSFDSRSALEEKYSGVMTRLVGLQGSAGLSSTDDKQQRGQEELEAPREEDWEGFSPSPPAGDRVDDGPAADSDSNDVDSVPLMKTVRGITVHHGIDATKLSTAHKKILKATGPYTKIVFNFPHVGGISTDVNRQVRSNQQLLVGFFNAAKPLLVTSTNPARTYVPSTTTSNSSYYDETDAGFSDAEEQDEQFQFTTGCILVTLFEGEPYTLWNIRDLARHCGLKVIESFKFPWSAYPGYRHARTIGDIVMGKDRSDQGKRKGAWRGEERDARCYVLTLKEAEGPYPASGQGKKRKTVDDEDSS